MEENMETEKERTLQMLRQAGIALSSERQRALAETMMTTLHLQGTPSREQVEAALSQLKVPLSEEILAMRGEH